MKNFFIIRWLGNTPISRKLYFTVGIMGLLIAAELGTLIFAVHTLSSVRACVGGEGLWSKAQKDAVYNLQHYGRSHDEQYYRNFQNFLKVPLGDRKARTEIDKDNPDYDLAFRYFLDGRLHPDDIKGCIKLFRRFSKISYISKAKATWVEGDVYILQLIYIGDELHNEISKPSPSDERINKVLDEIYPVNDKLTVLEDEFSSSIEDGSRFLAGLILKLLIGLVLTVEIFGLLLTTMISRSIASGLKEMIAAAKKVSAGDFQSRAHVYSRDEIGTLANSLNEMTGKLEQNINALKRSEQELMASKEIAEQSVVVQENFLANMSHEIRTPMNAVIGFANLLENTTLNDHQQQFVQAIKISGQNLMTIINDILDYSKLESGMVVIEQIPFSIGNVLDSLQILVRRKAEEKKLLLLCRADNLIPPIIIGDPTRLIQVLLNLTDNAIKFTEKGKVEITAMFKSETRSDVTIEFCVRDTGRGIAADKLSVIFERFKQASPETTRQYGGTGLGLSISKSLVELQKGTMTVKSEVNKGAEFSFAITYQKAKDGQKAVAETQKKLPEIVEHKPLRILMAEDNKLNQSLVKYVLAKYGIETEMADNGEIAIEKIKEKHYDIILMDIQMPMMDGYEATHVIRNELKLTIPIIALTAHAMAEEKEKCLSLGMNDYISKPFDPVELYNKVTALSKV